MKQDELLELLSHSHSSQFLLNRARRYYPYFIQLYANVGYAPTDGSQHEWEHRTVGTWQEVDTAVPDSCTGGFIEDRIVSSWGTLPFSPKVVYGHSVCMEKSLLAAATLYMQSLESLNWTERLGGFAFWGKRYANPIL